MSALGKLARNPELDVEAVVKEDLQVMLDRAKKAQDNESAKTIESALNRTSRIFN